MQGSTGFMAGLGQAGRDWLGSQQVIHWLQTSGVRILVILVGALILRAVLRDIAARAKRRMAADGVVTEEEKRLATLISLLRKAITVIVLGLATVMILDEAGVPIGPLLASAGVLGLAIGFGAQNLVRDVVAGIFILIENQFREGDVIQTAGVAGRVEHFGLRATVLRDLESRVHYIPNGEIKVVSNLTQDKSRTVLDIGVAYREDVDRVIATLKQLCAEMRADPAFSARILATEVLGVERLDDSAVVVRVYLETVPLEQWGVGREFRRRVLRTFGQLGIEIPFPHRTLYIGEGVQGVLPTSRRPEGA